jgi:hypothetical protein
MPATSEQADKLADELVQVGKILGFESIREASVSEGSSYRVDVLWRLLIAKDGPFPLANIASIEIQYSNSPASISHNIFKAEPTLHPSFHMIISYDELSEDYKKVLLENYPGAGLVILDGKSNVENLKLWMHKILEDRNEAGNLAETSRKFFTFVNEQAKKNSERSERRDSRFDYEYWFDPTVFKMDVEWTLTATTGTFGRTYFFADTIEKARKRLLDAFEERMTNMPLEWEGRYASLNKMKVTCYQICRKNEAGKNVNENDVFRVVITAKVGTEEANFETTVAAFGENVEEIEMNLLEDLRKGIEEMKSLPHRIFDQEVHTAKYSRIHSWEENIHEEVLVLSKDNISNEEQKEKLRSFFTEEFGLGVEEFLSLDEIDTKAKYFENLETIKIYLREVFNRDPYSFRRRMYNGEYTRLEDWLLRDDSNRL